MTFPQVSGAAVGIVACLLLNGSTIHGQSRAVAAQLITLPRCLHDREEAAADLKRREAAIRLAKEINSGQGRIFSLTRRYVSLAELVSLPPVPDGFRLRYHTDGQYYVFSLKDQRDACRYAVFSDQDGILYEKTPLPPQIAQ